MKVALNNLISDSLEFLRDIDFEKSMSSNDADVVFHSSALVGSKINKVDNGRLMNRNALPKDWLSNPKYSGCKINFAFKNAYFQVVKYLAKEYDITEGRLLKLLDILSYGDTEWSRGRWGLVNRESLRRFLRNVNDLRKCCKEMTEAEIYDFSFDIVYDFIESLSLTKCTLPLSLLIMYWIQREFGLIPLAMACDKNVFLTAIEPTSGDVLSNSNAKKKFRLFMRELLDRHLKQFIRMECKECGKKKTSRDRILELIRYNPNHTAKTMASSLGLSVQAVQKQITNLKKENRLMRIGPDRGGKWKVIEE